MLQIRLSSGRLTTQLASDRSLASSQSQPQHRPPSLGSGYATWHEYDDFLELADTDQREASDSPHPLHETSSIRARISRRSRSPRPISPLDIAELLVIPSAPNSPRRGRLAEFEAEPHRRDTRSHARSRSRSRSPPTTYADDYIPPVCRHRRLACESRARSDHRTPDHCAVVPLVSGAMSEPIQISGVRARSDSPDRSSSAICELFCATYSIHVVLLSHLYLFVATCSHGLRLHDRSESYTQSFVSTRTRHAAGGSGARLPCP
ncbi:hypothetical protein C8Q80DRAFT_678400 [Daedaleopsis nitida]|nr:hypothetical protein C8Q80DRAFT_678400 [Daedaleopsis nitida]